MGSNLFVRVGKDCTRRGGVGWVRFVSREFFYKILPISLLRVGKDF